EAQGFSHVIIQALGFHPQTVVVSAIATDAIAVADGYIKRSVRSEVDSPCQIAAGLPCVRDENLLNIGELGAAQASTCDAQREPLLTALRIREVHQLILGEFRMDRDEVQQVCGFTWSRRRSPDRLRRKDAIANYPQVAVALGYEDRSCVDKRQPPGME